MGISFFPSSLPHIGLENPRRNSKQTFFFKADFTYVDDLTGWIIADITLVHSSRGVCRIL